MMVDVEMYKINKLYQYVQDAPDEWDDGEHVRTYYSALFYQHVYGLKHNFSGYISRDAMSAKKDSTTRDHFLSARLIFRALMDQNREILKDFDKFVDLIRTCQTTVEVTRDQNNTYAIKFRMDGEIPIIKALTVEKYDSFGWFQEGKGFLTEFVNGQSVPKKFPLKHLVPDWLTEYEKKFVK